MQQISAGLGEIHKRGIIHRDLKPANSTTRSILLVIYAVIQGSDFGVYMHTWKVADFGITTAGTSKRLIATNNQRGTLHYLAPEIILCEPGVPSYNNKVDIWSLGAILYELCTGKKAFAQVNTGLIEVENFLSFSFVGTLRIVPGLAMLQGRCMPLVRWAMHTCWKNSRT